MKLLFINQYYWPDAAATAQLLTDLCEHLARQGRSVHVLCSRGAYDAGSAKGKPPGYELRHGVHVHRIRATGFAKRSFLGRLLDYLTFHVMVWLRVVFTGWRYHVIVTLTTPPLVGLCATPVKTLTRTRHVCWVMDLHPEVEFALGTLSPRKLIPKMLRRLNDLHLRRADACVALGSCMRDRLLEKRVAPTKVHVISNWGHDLEPSTLESRLALRKELGLGDKFVVMYSGNAGLVHTFDEIRAAMKELAGDERFVFVFAGGGKRMREVESFVKEQGLGNARFLPYAPRSDLGRTLALGDVHLMTLREGMAGLAVPSKLYGIMAAARPVVFIGPESCESAAQIRQHHCGLTVRLGDTAGLLSALRKLSRDAHLRREMGANARDAFEAEFTPAEGCARWSELLEKLR